MSTAQEYRHLIDECLNWASVCEREPYRTMLFEIAKEWHREAIRLGQPASTQGSTTEDRPFERRVGEKSGGVFERPSRWVDIFDGAGSSGRPNELARLHPAPAARRPAPLLRCHAASG
jgi:hypothetical protein